MNVDDGNAPRVWPWVVGGGLATVVAFVAGYVLQLDPVREEIIHTDSEGEWSARVIAVGRWSESSLAWSGPRRIDVEFVGPAKWIERVRTDFGGRRDPAEAMKGETQAHAYVRQELLRRARGRIPAQEP